MARSMNILSLSFDLSIHNSSRSWSRHFKFQTIIVEKGTSGFGGITSSIYLNWNISIINGQFEVKLVLVKAEWQWLLFLKQHVFVKHGCPKRQQSWNMAKISKSFILTPSDSRGHVMSVKCEEPIDELTVQVWLLYHNPNFKYCTLLVSGTDRQTNGQTDDPITRCPRRTFQAGGIKHFLCYFRSRRHDVIKFSIADIFLILR